MNHPEPNREERSPTTVQAQQQEGSPPGWGHERLCNDIDAL